MSEARFKCWWGARGMDNLINKCCILGVAPAYLLKLLSYLRPVRVGDRFARPVAVTI